MKYLSTARLRQFPAFFTAVTTWAWSHSKTSIPWTLMRKSPTMRPASLAGEPVTTVQTLNAEKDAQPMIRKKTKINDGSSSLCPVHKIGLPSSPSHTHGREQSSWSIALSHEVQVHEFKFKSEPENETHHNSSFNVTILHLGSGASSI